MLLVKVKHHAAAEALISLYLHK